MHIYVHTNKIQLNMIAYIKWIKSNPGTVMEMFMMAISKGDCETGLEPFTTQMEQDVKENGIMIN